MDATDADTYFGMVAQVDQGVFGGDPAAAPASAFACLAHGLSLSAHGDSRLLAAIVGAQNPATRPLEVSSLQLAEDRQQDQGQDYRHEDRAPAPEAVRKNRNTVTHSSYPSALWSAHLECIMAS